MKRIAVFTVVAVFAGLLAACAPAPGAGNTPTPPAETTRPSASPTPGGGTVTEDEGGAEAFVDALRQAGATVAPADSVEQAFFSVPGQIVQVNGMDVQVFEYSSKADRAAESAHISPDGTTIGTTMVTWVDEARFWAEGRLIVLYVGRDSDVIERIEAVMGEPIAGPAAVGGAQPEAVRAAVEFVAQSRGVPADRIRVVSFEVVDWPDSCLGIQEPGIACLMVITPGWRVVLDVDGETVEAHTDASGKVVRLK